LWKNPEERKYFVDLGVDRRIILKVILKTWVGCMFWSDLFLDTNRMWAVVEMWKCISGFHKMRGIFD
jgi:hypothetical protein